MLPRQMRTPCLCVISCRAAICLPEGEQCSVNKVCFKAAPLRLRSSCAADRKGAWQGLLLCVRLKKRGPAGSLARGH